MKTASTLESVKLLKDWSIWIVGIQTAAIAAIGALLKTEEPTFAMSAFGSAAVFFFVVSICFASFLLISLPAFYMRHPMVEESQDFVELPAFIGSVAKLLRNPNLSHLIAGQHTAFLIGIVCFGLFVYMRLHP